MTRVTGCLLWARSPSKLLTGDDSVKPHDTPRRRDYYLQLTEENEGPENLRNLPDVAQLVSGRDGIQPAAWLQGLHARPP